MNMTDFFNFRRGRLTISNLNLPEQPRRVRRATMALGGGGARGLSHLGVMQALRASNIEIERIVGVSMGSLIGAMCAVDSDWKQVEQRILALLHSNDFKKKLEHLFGAATSLTSRSPFDYLAWYGRLIRLFYARRSAKKNLESLSLMSENMLAEAIDFLLPDVKIQDLEMPLSIVAVDLLSGHRVVLETGSLREAVRASTAIAGIYPPVKWDDMLLCDIGTVDSIPVSVARAYASDLTIAVDVAQELSRIERCNSAFEVLVRMQEIGERMVRRQVVRDADIFIRPEVGSISWFDFTRPELLIERGRQAARMAVVDALIDRPNF